MSLYCFTVRVSMVMVRFSDRKEYLYSVILLSTQTWITQLYLQTTPYLPFLHKRSPDGGAPN